MTSDMEYRPFDPPPPPPGEPPGALYGHWSADPAWGPPAWPPTAHPTGRSRAMRRTTVAILAVACIGVGGGTGWALTSAALSNHSTASLTPGGSDTNPSGSTGNGGTSPSGNGSGTASASDIAKIDAAVVDINAAVAGSTTATVAGTGMIITSSGEVLTNNHVIDDTVNITAQVDGTGPTYKVSVIGYDAADDVALVKLQGASGLPTVPIGDSSSLSVGDQLTVIGNALGRGGTPAEVSGVVAQLDQTVTASDESGDQETLTGMIQVEANIQPGDSGGPEINANGRVVGMTTAGQESGISSRQSTATTGFAVPINKAMQIINEIRSGSGPNIHIGNAALLGVKVVTSSGGTTGALVDSTTPGSPAASVGITAGDRITSIGGHAVASSNDLHNAMAGFANGQSVSVTWIDTAGASHTATVTLGSASFPD
jgi:S1-C subfamily serine protease